MKLERLKISINLKTKLYLLTRSSLELFGVWVIEN